MEEGKAAEEGGRQILVFQCAGCRAIVGNSGSAVGSDEDLDLVTLRAASSIDVLMDECQTSEQGKDAGCAFSEIRCRQCRTLLGRMYRTTSHVLNPLQDLFSFHLSAITSYDPQQDEITTAGTPQTFGSVSQLKGIVNTVAQRVTHLENEDVKVQKMLIMQLEKICEHNEKLEKMGAILQQLASWRATISGPLGDTRVGVASHNPVQETIEQRPSSDKQADGTSKQIVATSGLEKVIIAAEALGNGHGMDRRAAGADGKSCLGTGTRDDAPKLPERSQGIKEGNKPENIARKRRLADDGSLGPVLAGSRKPRKQQAMQAVAANREKRLRGKS